MDPSEEQSVTCGHGHSVPQVTRYTPFKRLTQPHLQYIATWFPKLPAVHAVCVLDTHTHTQ